jgi:hypothetical protein
MSKHTNSHTGYRAINSREASCALEPVLAEVWICRVRILVQEGCANSDEPQSSLDRIFCLLCANEAINFGLSLLRQSPRT